MSFQPSAPAMIAHSAIIRDIKDLDGKYFVQEQIKLATTAGSGWVNFRWPNPVSKDVESKTVYIERVDELLIGGGIYKK
ncbi:MAG: hypothetical protein HHJ12_16965 [Glaciimonas sp.]|nr:hypothetical protein [Glaciimonas sp.]